MNVDIDASLVRELVAAQFPAWADLPIERVEFNSHDNVTFRLGAELSVRLPSHPRYAAQVDKEQKWLPRLAPFLPLPIPTPVAMGAPDDRYPLPWSVYRWLEGERATNGHVIDLTGFATTLAQFLRALQGIDTAGGPQPGEHNFFRGGPLMVYDAETRRAIAALRSQIDGDAVTAVWEDAIGSKRHGVPVWLHGDINASNLLVRSGRLSAVIDFGCSGVGDPACDLTIAWTFFAGESRESFRAELALDRATWARARGWALWKAVITLASPLGANASEAEAVRRLIDDVVADHRATA